MSQWKLRGYVHDSDEESEDLDTSSTGSNRESQYISNELPDRVHADGVGSEAVFSSGERIERENIVNIIEEVVLKEEDAQRPQEAQVEECPLGSPRLSSRKPSGTPDSIQHVPPPGSSINRRLPFSSQILGDFVSLGNTTIANAAGGNSQNEVNLLAEFGITPLSDSSDTDDLSDPPSDLDERMQYGALFASPTRRTTVQVRIPAAEVVQQRQPARRMERALRERKPVQLRPYLVEGERYRRELQVRGIRPVTRVTSPARKSNHYDAETQEREFDPEDNQEQSSPPEEVIAVSPVRRRPGRTQNSPRRFPDIQAHSSPFTNDVPRSAKKRKHYQSSTRLPTAHLDNIPSPGSSLADVWTIPHSPPYSSSPPIDRTRPTDQILKRPPATRADPNLPTPTRSSSVLGNAPADSDSDMEPVVRHIQRSRFRQHPRISIRNDSSSSEAEASNNATPTSDTELRQVSRITKGVLPASWIRLDRKRQEERNANKSVQSNATQLAESAGTPRGVARPVTKAKHRPFQSTEPGAEIQDLVEISDGSDDLTDRPIHRLADLQESTEATSGLAALLDERYAQYDSDNMENDPLHLFTLGESGRKRKKQSKLTEMFSKSKRIKLPGNDTGSARRFTNEKTRISRKLRRTPPPALSVVDFDHSPAGSTQVVPQFLGIAKRAARRRPDLARQTPKNKYIRLHTARDTEDANIPLRQWRGGRLKQKRLAIRQPLASLNLTQQLVRPPSTAANENTTLKRITPSATRLQSPAISHSPVTSNNPHVHQSPCGKGYTEVSGTSSSSRHKTTGAKKRRFTYRQGQLEGPQSQTMTDDRRLAFEQGLQRVEQRFRLEMAFARPGHSFQHPHMPIAADVSSPLPSIEDIQEEVASPISRRPPTSTRRVVRKPHAQRVDIEMREFRQPSEPPPDRFQNNIEGTSAQSREQGNEDHSVLQGLHPLGTRYPTTFDISPLQDGTYFHSSTFTGSGELQRALLTTRTHARDLDEHAGYCTIEFNGLSLRCGPWDGSIFANLVNAAINLWNPTPSLAFTNPGRVTDSISDLLRSLINYLSMHVSFYDPIDRRSLLSSMELFVESLVDNIMSLGIEDTNSDMPAKNCPARLKPMTLLLVLILQTCKIVHHPSVELAGCAKLKTILSRVAKVVVEDLVNQVFRLYEFLENNKRWKVRENGIQDSDVVVESLVISMNALSEASTPGTTFWSLLNKHLYPQARNAYRLADFESLWGVLFAFLPFTEMNECGILERRRRTTFQQDDWTVLRAIMLQLTKLYPSSPKRQSSLYDYVRAVLTRCHNLIDVWHWRQCEAVLNVVFDFFMSKPGFEYLRQEQGSDKVSFLNQLNSQSSLHADSGDTSFHIFLKCIFLGIQEMSLLYTEAKLRSVVWRLIPSHDRSYPKDQPLDTDSLVALRYYHDLLSTLYRASLPSCRPKLDKIRNLVDHEKSHREACKISVHAWGTLTAFQLATEEPYSSAQPFAEWYKVVMMQTLKQYSLARTEVDDYLQSESANTVAASRMAEQTLIRNREQLIATLRDSVQGMHKAISTCRNHVILRNFLQDSDLAYLLGLAHLEDFRLGALIQDALSVLRTFAKLLQQRSSVELNLPTNDESQDYGVMPDLDDIDDIVNQDPSPHDFLEAPLWQLLSNAFGAEVPPSENVLMDCIDTWIDMAHCQVSMSTRSWAYYLDTFGKVSWQQLRPTEQKQKFGPYFMTALITCDPIVYQEYRLLVLKTLMVSLADRESMLRFQHRLLGAIIHIAPNDPLVRNLPFFTDDPAGSLGITAESVRARRLSLISSILCNMRDDYLVTTCKDPLHALEVKAAYNAILKDFMAAMKDNYLQLRQSSITTGVYVEFVQKTVQFLQQHTADLCPVSDFFTNSTAFPLPAADPTYVVGRLCGYASKLGNKGVPIQLSVFMQTVVQQAATGGHQTYLVRQLQDALCTNQAPIKDRIALRDTLLQGIFPMYIDLAFSSLLGLVVARPILKSLKLTIEAMNFDVRVFNDQNIRAVCGCLLSVSQAFIRGVGKVVWNQESIRQPHILQALCLMFDIMGSVTTLLDYICSRCLDASTRPSITVYFDELANFIMRTLDGTMAPTIPSYHGATDITQSPHYDILRVSESGLERSIKASWSFDFGRIFFGQGHTKREVEVDIGDAEQEKRGLVAAIEVFNAATSVFCDDDTRYVGRHGKGCIEWDIDV